MDIFAGGPDKTIHANNKTTRYNGIDNIKTNTLLLTEDDNRDTNAPVK